MTCVEIAHFNQRCLRDVQHNQMYMPSAKSMLSPDASPRKNRHFFLILCKYFTRCKGTTLNGL